MNANDVELEEFTPIDDMLVLIKGSDIDPVVPRFSMSRMLLRPSKECDSLCYRRKLDVPFRCLAPLGSYVARTLGAEVGSYNGKLLLPKSSAVF